MVTVNVEEANPQRKKREFGSMKGLIEIDDSFFDPLPPEELAAWEGSYVGPEGEDA